MRTCSKFQRAIESALVGDASPAALARAERHAKACGTCELIWPEVQATLELFKSVSVEASRVSRESLGTSRARLRAAFARAGCPPVAFSSVRSPVGLVYFGMSDRGLCDVTFGLRRDADYRRRLGRRVPEIWRDDAALREVRAEFLAYFDGSDPEVLDSGRPSWRDAFRRSGAAVGETTSVRTSNQLRLLG